MVTLMYAVQMCVCHITHSLSHTLSVLDVLQELFWTSLFFVRWQIMFGSMLGFGGVFLLYIFVRCVQHRLLSHMLVFVELFHPSRTTPKLGHSPKEKFCASLLQDFSSHILFVSFNERQMGLEIT